MTPARQAVEIARAVYEIALSQVALEENVANHGHRLDAIEANLGMGDHAVSQDQASQLSQAVKAVAIPLTTGCTRAPAT